MFKTGAEPVVQSIPSLQERYWAVSTETRNNLEHFIWVAESQFQMLASIPSLQERYMRPFGAGSSSQMKILFQIFKAHNFH